MSQIDSDIKKALHYAPDTGDFFWLQTLSSKRRAGSKAGCLSTDTGYIKIRYKNKLYLAHRLAWYFTNGEIPVGYMIDHINGDKSNNSINNLRLVDGVQNSFNRKVKNTNTSGYTGVSFNKKSNKWRAYIVINGKQKHLGTFASKEDASAAYQKALAEVKKSIGLD